MTLADGHLDTVLSPAQRFEKGEDVRNGLADNSGVPVQANKGSAVGTMFFVRNQFPDIGQF